MVGEMLAVMLGVKMIVTLAVYVAMAMVQCMREGEDIMQNLSGILLNGVIFAVVLSVVMVICEKMGVPGM